MIRELKLILRRGTATQTQTNGRFSSWRNSNLFAIDPERAHVTKNFTRKKISRCLASRLSTVPSRLKTFLLYFCLNFPLENVLFPKYFQFSRTTFQLFQKTLNFAFPLFSAQLYLVAQMRATNPQYQYLV